MAKFRRPNGKYLSPLQSAKILSLLCAGKSVNEVAKATGSHWHTVKAVEFNNAATVEERKRLLADRAEALASDALTLLHSKVVNGGHRIKPSALVPIFGVSVDKAIALRSDNTINVSHTHAHIHAHISESSYSDLLNNLPSKSTHTILAETVPTHPDATQKE